jgi:hypothetical protein
VIRSSDKFVGLTKAYIAVHLYSSISYMSTASWNVNITYNPGICRLDSQIHVTHRVCFNDPKFLLTMFVII